MKEIDDLVLDDLLEELKNRLHITTNDDDENLTSLIKTGYGLIIRYCGDFDIDKNIFGKNLVFEYCRFARNGVAEHFYSSYMQDLVTLGFELMDVGDESAN